jgi:V/A-type H+-transporting ATPase subunit C
MAGYDYGNARLRAMRSRLLPRADLESLAEIRNLDDLITALTQSDYRRAVERAIVRASGMACIAEALRLDLIDKFAKISSFYSGREQEMVGTLFRTYDVHNLKTVLRGLSSRASPGEIEIALIPIGELTSNILDELIRTSEPRIAIDLLASMRLAISRPLIDLRAERRGASVAEMEQALDRWYFQEARRQALEPVLASALSLEADIVNLLIALRFAHAPSERPLVHEWSRTGDLRDLFVGPGDISLNLLSRLAKQNTMDEAIELMAGTAYAAALSRGLAVYKQSKRLSDIEKALKRLRLRRLGGLIMKDPLGIGVPLSYFALKTSEVTNLHWIAQGINLGLDSKVIKRELEFAL